MRNSLESLLPSVAVSFEVVASGAVASRLKQEADECVLLIEPDLTERSIGLDLENYW